MLAAEFKCVTIYLTNQLIPNNPFWKISQMGLIHSPFISLSTTHARRKCIAKSQLLESTGGRKNNKPEDILIPIPTTCQRCLMWQRDSAEIIKNLEMGRSYWIFMWIHYSVRGLIRKNEAGNSNGDVTEKAEREKFEDSILLSLKVGKEPWTKEYVVLLASWF